MFDPKIIVNAPTIVWGFVGVGVVITTTVKLVSRNYISRKEVYSKLQNIKMCDQRYDTLIDKIDNVQSTVNMRFDDLKDLINGK